MGHRRLRRVIGAFGFGLALFIGFLGLVTIQSEAQPDLAPLLLVPVGLALWAQSLGESDLRGLRTLLGAVGLLVVAIAGSMAILALAIDPAVFPTLSLITLLGLVLWIQAAARGTDLGYRVTAEWMLVFILLVLGAAGLAVLLKLVGEALGFPSWSQRRLDGVAYAFIAAAFIFWSRRHPRRGATIRALGHLAMARATTEDVTLLTAGPRALLRPEPASPHDPPPDLASS